MLYCILYMAGLKSLMVVSVLGLCACTKSIFVAEEILWPLLHGKCGMLAVQEECTYLQVLCLRTLLRPGCKHVQKNVYMYIECICIPHDVALNFTLVWPKFLMSASTVAPTALI